MRGATSAPAAPGSQAASRRTSSSSARSRASSSERGNPAAGTSASRSVGCDGRHEVEVGAGGGAQDGVGGRGPRGRGGGRGRAGRPRSAGRAGRGARRVAVGACRTSSVERGRAAVGSQRQGPAERPDVPCALLGGGVRRALNGPRVEQPAPAAEPRRRPDDRSPSTERSGRQRWLRSVAADRDLDEVGQREQQVRGTGRGRGQQRVRVEARAQRQADLRRVAVGRRRLVRARRPHQPQHRQLTVAAGQLGGRAGQLARRRPRSPRPRTRRRRRTVTTRGASDSASTAAKPTPNRPTDPASSRFADARSAASALTPGGVQRRAGVRHTQLAVVHGDPQPARDTRGPRGVGGVLRELDAPACRAYPPSRRSSSAFASSRNRVGESAQAARTPARSAAVPNGSPRRSARHRRAGRLQLDARRRRPARRPRPATPARTATSECAPQPNSTATTVAVGGRVGVGADPERAAQRSGERQQEPAGAAVRGSGAGHVRARAVLAVVPALRGGVAALAAQHRPPAQADLAGDLLHRRVVGREVAGHQRGRRRAGWAAGRRRRGRRAAPAPSRAPSPGRPARPAPGSSTTSLTVTGASSSGRAGQRHRPAPAPVPAVPRGEEVGDGPSSSAPDLQVLADRLCAAVAPMSAAASSTAASRARATASTRRDGLVGSPTGRLCHPSRP